MLFGVVNLLASILSGASGGAGGMIATPFMVLLGLTPAQAIATAKFSGFGVSVGASSRFFKEKLSDRKTVIIFSLIGALAALAGSLTLVHFQDESDLIQKVMGVVILGLGVPMLYIRNLGLVSKTPPTWLKTVGLCLLSITVFIQIAVGSGSGSLQLIILMGCFGMTALVASATRRLMQLTVASVGLAVFIAAGLVDYRFGIMGLATSLIGGYVGAHIAIKKGNKFVINLLAVTSVLLALQLLFGK